MDMKIFMMSSYLDATLQKLTFVCRCLGVILDHYLELDITRVINIALIIIVNE